MKSQVFGFLVALIMMLTIATVSAACGYVGGLNLHVFVPLCVLVSFDWQFDTKFGGKKLRETVAFGVTWSACKYWAAVHLLGLAGVLIEGGP